MEAMLGCRDGKIRKNRRRSSHRAGRAAEPFFGHEETRSERCSVFCRLTQSMPDGREGECKIRHKRRGRLHRAVRREALQEDGSMQEDIIGEETRLQSCSSFCRTTQEMQGWNDGRESETRFRGSIGDAGLLQLYRSFVHLFGREEEKRLNHYSSFHKILLVGEGDFSFANALATAFGCGVNIVATSLDSREELVGKYGGACVNLGRLTEMGCTVLHGVDCHTMASHPILAARLFDRIVFNFPHAGFMGREDDDHQILLHRRVVEGFLRNARMMLAKNGEVHVTHKAGGPFDRWQIAGMAGMYGLGLVEKVRFYLCDYPGYQNKRGDGHRSDEPFNVGVSYTFKFTALMNAFTLHIREGMVSGAMNRPLHFTFQRPSNL